jgi:hypothetical protein
MVQAHSILIHSNRYANPETNGYLAYDSFSAAAKDFFTVDLL